MADTVEAERTAARVLRVAKLDVPWRGVPRCQEVAGDLPPAALVEVENAANLTDDGERCEVSSPRSSPHMKTGGELRR